MTFDDFLPSLERAQTSLGPLEISVGWPFTRKVDILRVHAKAAKLALTVLDSRSLIRDRWTDEDVELSRALHHELSTAPRDFVNDFQDRSYRVLDTTVPGVEQACTNCATRRGLALCTICGGSGMRGETRCSCEGGFVKCRSATGPRARCAGE